MDSLIWIQASLMQNAVNGFFAALGLGLVIFFHELGHFAVAKWCDVYVERFSIGFGPVIFGWKWGETEYVLSAIPFGGYVKMLGQDDSDPSQLTNEELAADPRSYSAKPVWQRMAIISAGVTMNVITAMIFFCIAYLQGVPSLPPIVGGARPGSPAWIAGIEAGDRIERINGHKVTSFIDVSQQTALSDNVVRLEGHRRDGVTKFDVTMEPFTYKTHPSITRPQIGLATSASLVAESWRDPKLPPVVPDRAASRAKPSFASGDKIVEVNGHPVQAFADFERQIAGRTKPETQVIVERRSGDETSRIPIEVGADYFRTLGLRMDCSPITAIQRGSPAEEAGLKVGDKLLKVNGLNLGTDLDPLKLPNEFARWAGEPVEVRVKRQKEGGGTEEITAHVTPNDRPGWSEQPLMEGEPLTIPAIGAAYHIIPKVVSVEPGSAGEEAGIKPEARITSIKFVAEPGAEPQKPKPGAISSFFGWISSFFGSRQVEETGVFSLDDPKDPRKENSWAFLFWYLQQRHKGDIALTVQQGTETKKVTLTPKIDPEWMLPQIGLEMKPLEEKLQAHSIAEALELSWNFTGQTAVSIYMTLRSLTVTQRLSIKELHGPIGIASATWEIASRSIAELLHFLGLLSVNLAVLNFLPIPVLDGGHMVFLLWEGVTRRKPSERVVIGATYVGLLFILSLTCLVLYVDIARVFQLGRWF